MIHPILDAASPGLYLGLLGGGVLVLVLIIFLLVTAVLFIVRKVKKRTQKIGRAHV